MPLPLHCLIVRPRRLPDPRSRRLLHDAHALGLTRITSIVAADLYFIEGTLTAAEQLRLEAELLSDPVAQIAEWRGHQSSIISHQPGNRSTIIEVVLKPGVADPVAEQIVRAAKELGISGVTRAATGQRYVVRGKRLRKADLHALARGLLANGVIQHYALGSLTPHFPEAAAANARVETIALRELNDDELLALSRERRAALDLAEMQAIQRYFRAEGRDPTDVEFEMIAQTWSEHCVHKTFKAMIEIRDWRLSANLQSPISPINSLLRTYLKAATDKIAAPWVRSAFVDNAGIIEFDDEYEVSFKVETHNHPSAIEPFGGANTGVGGVIRDILGVSAKPIAATDVLCFGPQDIDPKSLPEGVLHPRRVRSGVVAGIEDYGNKIGLPTVNGAILYDPGYTANPLVFCGCVGLAPKGKHPRGPRPGDRILVLGGRTGRDGLRGATFSSMTMDAQTGEVAGASVQIGDPITEKGLIEVITRARDEGLYHAITDCGAGGLSSAVGEMASACGAEVDLSRVRLKYAGLAPWEIWLSEAQERMVLAAPPDSLDRLQALCALFDVELTDIGAFTATGRLTVRYGDTLVLDLANEFLHEGIPQRRLQAEIRDWRLASAQSSVFNLHSPPSTFNATLLALLAHPNIASKADVIRVYDHEVQGGTVVKPLTGAQNDGPSDACVLKPAGTKGMRGIVLSNGINPQYGKLDPYRMALSAVDEAIRNAVAVGADPERIALLDNFCWGDPNRPETLGALVEAARGCHDAALHYGAPFISGKDSLNNEYLGADGQRHAIPGTLLISAIGLIEDVGQAVTMDLKAAGDVMYLLGETRPEFGGSHFDIVRDAQPTDKRRHTQHAIRNTQHVPDLPPYAPRLYRALHAAMRAGLVRACHDLSEGGLAVAAAEMCIGGRLGMALTLATDDPITALFSESNGRLLVEVHPSDCAAFEQVLAGLPLARLGMVTGGDRLTLTTTTETLISLTTTELLTAWQSPISNL
ncbi:MAG: phosphoribosylformylglycinamidine synthase subunit PurL [Anaerolineales bacterium]|nr:phosphoribosylformylglycinamidine synthase subunit PurL [Anaerolineales bacterium]